MCGDSRGAAKRSGEWGATMGVMRKMTGERGVRKGANNGRV